MYSSTVTSKGQTTIPKKIRKLLHLKSKDKIVYIYEDNKVFLKPIKGTILNLKGVIKHSIKKPIDFYKLRDEVKQKIAKESIEE